jgi:hypothetical protein
LPACGADAVRAMVGMHLSRDTIDHIVGSKNDVSLCGIDGNFLDKDTIPIVKTVEHLKSRPLHILLH